MYILHVYTYYYICAYVLGIYVIYIKLFFSTVWVGIWCPPIPNHFFMHFLRTQTLSYITRAQLSQSGSLALIQYYYLIPRPYSHFTSCPNNVLSGHICLPLPRTQLRVTCCLQGSCLCHPLESRTLPQPCFVFQDPDISEVFGPVVLFPHRFQNAPEVAPLTTLLPNSLLVQTQGRDSLQGLVKP